MAALRLDSERQHRMRLQRDCNGQQPLDLLSTPAQRYLLRFFEMIDLSGQIKFAQHHLEQKLDAAHNPVVFWDARGALDPIQLERLDLIDCRCVR
jgi:hypothetical protein